MYGLADSQRSLGRTLDWWLIACYLFLVFFGWINIYASVQNDELTSIFAWSARSGKQFVWIMTSLVLACVFLFSVNARSYEIASPLLYCIVIFLLIAVIFVGSDIKGSHSWFKLGPVSFQPAEISKITTSLMLASFMNRHGFKLQGRNFWRTAAIILLPMLIIVAEKETGSALVYVGFVFALYREGLSGWLIVIGGVIILTFILTLVYSPAIGILTVLVLITLFDSCQNRKPLLWCAIAIPLIVAFFFVPQEYRLYSILSLTAVYAVYTAYRGFRGVRQDFRLITLVVLVGLVVLVFSTDFVFNNILHDYQRSRIEVLLGLKEDMSGAGYNVHQSMIAIGSGGMFGKGFCQGTQTAYGFVPEQSTDFIFCTVGEEWGFAGCIFLLAVYLTLIFRIIIDSEHSRSTFTRVYGYCLASCFFMHLFINIGMTLGLVPVIGIPLPFMSYGGSSMWAFTTMLFIFIALDRNERKYF